MAIHDPATFNVVIQQYDYLCVMTQFPSISRISTGPPFDLTDTDKILQSYDAAINFCSASNKSHLTLYLAGGKLEM